jgi:hypothetical protein
VRLRGHRDDASYAIVFDFDEVVRAFETINWNGNKAMTKLMRAKEIHS